MSAKSVLHLMDAKTLEQFYYKLMKDNTHENEVQYGSYTNQ